MNVIKYLYDKGLTNLGGHHWMADNIHYLTMMGSVAYGVNTDTSDCDVYGFCIPPKEDLFPHLKGEVVGFGNAKHANNRFSNFQQHHIQDVDADKEYDLNVYNIVDYFQLVMENNPNMIDSLFTPQFCVLHSTKVGQMVREKRKMFLHRGSWHTFKGYAFAQMKKMKVPEVRHCPRCQASPTLNKFDQLHDGKYCCKCVADGELIEPVMKKVNRKIGKRAAKVEEDGYDLKFAYHIVRLLNEVEQIMTEGDIDLQRNREQLKAIRRGEWTLEQIEQYFHKKEVELETLYNENKANLSWGPQEDGLQDRIKQLLFQCLEEHYGSLEKCVVNPDAAVMALREMGDVLNKYRKLL